MRSNLAEPETITCRKLREKPSSGLERDRYADRSTRLARGTLVKPRDSSFAEESLRTIKQHVDEQEGQTKTCPTSDLFSYDAARNDAFQPLVAKLG